MPDGARRLVSRKAGGRAGQCASARAQDSRDERRGRRKPGPALLRPGGKGSLVEGEKAPRRGGDRVYPPHPRGARGRDHRQAGEAQPVRSHHDGHARDERGGQPAARFLRKPGGEHLAHTGAAGEVTSRRIRNTPPQGQSIIGGVANGQEGRKGRRAEENRSRKSRAAHRFAGTGSRESPERVSRRAAVEGRGGNAQERAQFADPPAPLGQGGVARHAPGHRERPGNDRRRRPEGEPIHRGDRKNSGDVIEGLMKNLSISVAILFAATLGACGASAQAQGDRPAVVRLDPALDALVSPDARLELVKGGFGFTEGLIWVEQGRYLLLSDIPANVIYTLTSGSKASFYMHRSA